jgi:hypothetical protein
MAWRQLQIATLPLHPTFLYLGVIGRIVGKVEQLSIAIHVSDPDRNMVIAGERFNLPAEIVNESANVYSTPAPRGLHETMQMRLLRRPALIRMQRCWTKQKASPAT